ncbi:MAG: alpha/beta hydrolase, partial [Thermomicrobiales bacterium]|nr:alpha/beta hydrolase [Thermomicrobiales bacterium]
AFILHRKVSLVTSEPSAAFRQHAIPANGVSIAVAEFPAPGRPPLLLLHGIGSRGESWWPVVDALAEHFHLFQLDLRGHGNSAKPERGYAVEAFAEDVQGVLEVLGLGRPAVLGHSLGALVTLYWASQHPTAAAALVLEDPPLHTLPEILPAFDGWVQLSSLTPEQAAAWYHQEYPHWTLADCQRRAETITSTAPGVFADLRAASALALETGDTDRTPILAGVQSPALLLRGNPELGGMTTLDDAARFREFLPHGEVVEIMDAGHGLHRDATEAFLDVVLPFLQRHTAG